ncbi:ABC transporter permease [Anaerocolumna xylanovorans]|uniref:ABC-2 type transport system permease protein n=1 Tax=Anaerocolumna xylanovorans DSM 12503 TaxID=1121345 RepID=A0A1M7XWW8_9FIRM|nr:ABC transporter permease [Anaerocolumna xylanovorans]SHO43286.1 ABC-2 type transport system permease protein [Anaerocolumna xylanovorans DSM 12503]
MNALRTLLIMNIKLLIRNKGFLFFLFAVPVLSVMLLNIRLGDAPGSKVNIRDIIEQKDMTEKIVYDRDYTLMPILVYDKSMTELSRYFQEQLAKTGIYQIYRVDATHITDTEIADNRKLHLERDVVASFICLDKDFDKKAVNGRIEDGFTFYKTGLDEREELLYQSVKQTAVFYHTAAGNKNADDMLKQLKALEKIQPEKKVTIVENGGLTDLTDEQKIDLYAVKISIAVVTIAFLYAGIFIAQTAVEEKNNLVYTRLKLTGTSELTYMLSKIIITLVTGFLQTVIMGIGIALFVKADFGISIWNYLFLIGLLGMVFCNMSLVMGILLNNVMNACYLAFMIWSVSSMLSGLYFPLEEAGKLLKNLSNLMPQNWTIVAAEGIMGKDISVYFMILCVTAAYIVIIMSTGAIGLRYNRNE